MKFALYLPNCHQDFADPLLFAEVAYEAEQSGWDGLFLWDHMTDAWANEVSDPWIMLAAAVMRTQRMRLGTMITPLPRRRPWKVAREIVTLDHLSAGRMVLGVGIADANELINYFEESDPRRRGEMLDEGLEILIKLWSGERFSYDGKYYHLQDVRHLPVPIQQPRIPIWVAAKYGNKKPMQRAARWDGFFPVPHNPDLLSQLTLHEFHDCIQFIAAERQGREGPFPYEFIQLGHLQGDDPLEHRDQVLPYREAGATWWLENCNWGLGSLEEIRPRIRRGPPQL